MFRCSSWNKLRPEARLTFLLVRLNEGETYPDLGCDFRQKRSAGQGGWDRLKPEGRQVGHRPRDAHQLPRCRGHALLVADKTQQGWGALAAFWGVNGGSGGDRAGLAAVPAMRQSCSVLSFSSSSVIQSMREFNEILLKYLFRTSGRGEDPITQILTCGTGTAVLGKCPALPGRCAGLLLSPAASCKSSPRHRSQGTFIPPFCSPSLDTLKTCTLSLQAAISARYEEGSWDRERS